MFAAGLYGWDWHTGHLIHEQAKPSENDPTPSLQNVVLEYGGCFLCSLILLQLNSHPNRVHLGDNILIVRRQIMDSTKDLEGFILTAALVKPSGRFR